MVVEDETRRVAADGATPLQVEQEVIPRILEQRGDIREGLYGRVTKVDGRKCFEMITGSLQCVDPPKPFVPCKRWICVASLADECMMTAQIPCPEKDLNVLIGR